MNIAYLTSEYHDERLGNKDPFTYISNGFAKCWVNQGHNVIVIHNASCFPKFLYYIPQKLKDIYESKTGTTWGNYDALKEDNYFDKNVHVYRMPIKKYIPHRSPSNKELSKQTKKIIKIFNDNNFIPDVIIGQWVSPQMELLYNLKKYYDCPNAVVLHGNNYINSQSFNSNLYLSNIDKIGTRSYTTSLEVQKILNLQYKPFVCYSGIPNEFLKDYKFNESKFRNIRKWKFAFVGRLVEYKHPDSVIKALASLEIDNWELNILGEGEQREYLEKLCVQLKCEKNVKFYGKVPRSEVMKILQDCHFFTMISVGEVFGLVYLEAMGSSCITIASKDGGIDGVIKNKYNGLLTEAGNVENLSNLYKDLLLQSEDDLIKIANNGYQTALDFSEYNIAKKFLSDVLE